MRILWLSHFVPWPANGMGMLQRSHHLLREAASRHEVHLVALNDRALLSSEELASARTGLAALCAAVDLCPRTGATPRGERVWALLRSLASGSAYDAAWMRAASFDARVRALARRARFDLVHVDTVGLLRHVRALRGTPVVVNHHNVESLLMRQRARREPSRLRRALYRREARALERLECAAADAAHLHLAVSSLDAARLREVSGARNVRVVPNGVDTRWFSPQQPLGHGRGGLIFVGAMDWQPTRDAVLHLWREIWPALQRDCAGRRLAIVGRGAPAELRAEEGDALEVPGFVEDVRPWLDAASIYLCPLRQGGGTRVKVLDALAMAKPIVATQLAVEGLDLEEGRHYLRAETPEQYVAQVRRLERDADLRRRLAAAGRRHVEQRFAWSAIGPALDEAWRHAVTLSTRGPAPGTGIRRSSATRPRAEAVEGA